MLAFHLLLTPLLRQLLGRHYGGPGFLGEKFGGGMHGHLPRLSCWINRMSVVSIQQRGEPNGLIRSSLELVGNRQRGVPL